MKASRPPSAAGDSTLSPPHSLPPFFLGEIEGEVDDVDGAPGSICLYISSPLPFPPLPFFFLSKWRIRPAIEVGESRIHWVWRSRSRVLTLILPFTFFPISS